MESAPLKIGIACFPLIGGSGILATALGSDLKLHPCWTDFRGNPGTTLPNQDVVTQSISVLG